MTVWSAGALGLSGEVEELQLAASIAAKRIGTIFLMSIVVHPPCNITNTIV